MTGPTPAPGAPPPEAVEVRALAHRYVADSRSVEALAGVDLDLAPGEFVAVVGPSGCGKSTLLRVLAGVLVPTAGSAEIGGEGVIGRPGHAAHLPQRDLLLPWRRALDNATLGLEVSGVPRAEARRRARPLLDRFGLGGFEEAWPSQLSGGMRQRLALARTMLMETPLLLLDEPFGALDALTRREVQAWLGEVWLDDRRTTLLVTHDVEEAVLLSDRVVVLSARPGRVVAEVPVTLPRPRPAASVTDPGFVALRARVLAALAGGPG